MTIITVLLIANKKYRLCPTLCDTVTLIFNTINELGEVSVKITHAMIYDNTNCIVELLFRKYLSGRTLRLITNAAIYKLYQIISMVTLINIKTTGLMPLLVNVIRNC